ncbi:hypothetical protein EG347_11745 [Chryseobacterium sp. G0186]|uniref:DUF6680 family protein n=1 Tax=Chryseobacterium sp. G0186 TaxID=2487064 RepID=UPI000F4ED11B|nr:DUF6680 family protein [Chryseobacterium sp. G0186]AZA78139.1 hypothetical protein EG347_11745 [Chryseobacterium sp. G0186]
MKEFLQSYGQLFTLLSVTLIPFTIWWLGIKFQDRKAKRDAKLNLFFTLMANRATNPVVKEWVDALNLIDIVFQSNKKVRTAWAAYYDALHPRSQHMDNIEAFKLDLLSEMANDLGYKDLKQTEIGKTYSPQAFRNRSDWDIKLQNEIYRVLSASKSFSQPFTDDELNNNAQNEEQGS